jgi:hypothetical protein
MSGGFFSAGLPALIRDLCIASSHVVNFINGEKEKTQKLHQVVK